MIQITGSTLKTLKGEPDRKKYIEIKKHPIFLENNERLDPLVNIASSIRWLGHKIEIVPKGHKKTIEQ